MFIITFHEIVDALELFGSEFKHLFNFYSFISILKCNESFYILFVRLVLNLKKMW